MERDRGRGGRRARVLRRGRAGAHPAPAGARGAAAVLPPPLHRRLQVRTTLVAVAGTLRPVRMPCWAGLRHGKCGARPRQQRITIPRFIVSAALADCTQRVTLTS